MKRTIRKKTLIYCVLCVSLLVPVLAQDHKTWSIHKFELWGTMRDRVEKLIFLEGFTNGLFMGPRPPEFLSLANCIEGVPPEQTIAMIDKYYRENPEKWNIPIGSAIVSAVTVKGGPCEAKTLP